MSKKRDARHFHAGKLRKKVDGVEYIVPNGRARSAGGFRWRFAEMGAADV